MSALWRWVSRVYWTLAGGNWARFVSRETHWDDDEPIPYTITEAGKAIIARGIPKAKA